jgi:hypothetical protein
VGPGANGGNHTLTGFSYRPVTSLPVCSRAARTPRMVNQWEYMLLAGKGLDEERLVDKLNELGAEGWEVVAHVGYETLDSIVLKRPRVVRDKAAGAEGVN